MSVRILATNAIWSMVAHLLQRGSLIVVSIILAQQLDTSDFAAYNYFQMTASMLAAYSALGVGVTASRFFAEVGHVRDETPPIGTLWILSLLAGLSLSSLVLVLPGELSDGGLDVPSWLLALGIFTLTLGVVPGGGVLGLEQYAKASVPAAISALVLVLGTLTFGREGGKNAMVVFVAGTLVSAVGNTIIIFRQIGLAALAKSIDFSRNNFASIASFAGPMVGVSLLSASGSWLVGRMILSGEAGEYEFALYAIGIQWFSLVLFLPGMVSRVILPRIVRERLTRSKNASGNLLVRQGSLLATSAAVVTCLVGLVISPHVLDLYGNEYAINEWLLVAFMLAAIPSAPANTIGNAIVADNGQRLWLIMTVLWFACMVSLASILASLGALGGAAAQGLAALVLTSVAAIFARSRNLV